MNKFKFMEPVATPMGTGLFIGNLTDGAHCQVAIRVDNIQKNPIFRLDEVKAKWTRQSEQQPDPVSQVDDLPLECPVSETNGT